MTTPSEDKPIIVLTTIGTAEAARKLAQQIVETKLAACANIIPQIESWYWWEGKVEQGNELLLLLKTTSDRYAQLERHIKQNHPYDLPEIVILPIEGGNADYLNWIRDSLA